MASKSKSFESRISGINLSGCSKSTFTISFVVEVVGFDVVYEEHTGDWLDLSGMSPIHGVKLQYQLSPAHCYEIDIAIYPQCAKIVSSSHFCWVRTWQFSQRRWLTFTISHALPVRVTQYREFQAKVEPLFGLQFIDTGAKERPSKVYFHPMTFGLRRYFQIVTESLPTDRKKTAEYVRSWIWSRVQDFIPASYLDMEFDKPQPASDIRHQDAIIGHVQKSLTKPSHQVPIESNDAESLQENTKMPRKESSGKNLIDKNNKSNTEKKIIHVPKKYGLKLSGDAILAGTGRVIAFETEGEKSEGMGSIIALISTGNLPAQDDLPITFVNIETLYNAPLEEFRKLGITHLYTRWYLRDWVHDSQHVDIRSSSLVDEIKFNDHHALPLHPNEAILAAASYLDNYYKIELRGKKAPFVSTDEPYFYGFDKSVNLSMGIKTITAQEELDFIIANTRIDNQELAKGVSSFRSGEYSLFPPDLCVQKLNRAVLCTNDINMIRVPMKPHLVVPASLVLLSQMTLEVSMGVIGCRPQKLISCYSRLFCHVRNSEAITTILNRIMNINVEFAENANERLTGFALDTGDVVILYVEGMRDGYILRIWEMTEDFYPKINPVFSSKTRHSSRVYPEVLHSSLPFIYLKTKAPLGLILACPAVYTRPTLPVPARMALMKVGQLVQMKHRSMIFNCMLPTTAELASFRLELCSPSRNTDVEQAIIEENFQS